jgi:4-diphosphocytidyl-2-C-methyl-D-erythritol kinase
MSEVVIARAFAKLNLALSVGPALPASAGDQAGFHPIASWFCAVDLWDDLTLTRLGDAEASRYTIQWAGDAPRTSALDWPIEKDLAVRAHRLVEARVGRALPVEMRLSKRIPVGGGLGGGSSDAAAMLRSVDRLFQLHLPGEVQLELSRRLGSDVAYFLDGEVTGPPRGAIVTGLGERVERVESVAGWAVLLIPAVGCPTGPVYRAFDAAAGAVLRERQVREVVAASRVRGGIDTRALFNDLAGPAQSVQPVLARIRADAEQALETSVHVTGSGSTLFAMAQSPERAAEMAQCVERAGIEAAAVATALL